MKSMIVNTLGFLMVAFVLFLVFKKLKSLLPSFLTSSLSKQPVPVPVEQVEELDTDSENEDDLHRTSNIIELDEEDIDVDDVNSDDEIILKKADNNEDVELEVSDDNESVSDNEPVEEPAIEPIVEKVEEPVKVVKTKSKAPKGLKNRKGKTIKL